VGKAEPHKGGGHASAAKAGRERVFQGNGITGTKVKRRGGLRGGEKKEKRDK